MKPRFDIDWEQNDRSVVAVRASSALSDERSGRVGTMMITMTTMMTVMMTVIMTMTMMTMMGMSTRCMWARSCEGNESAQGMKQKQGVIRDL